MKPAQLKFYQDASGDWRWRVVAGNGRVLADSGEGYRRRKACEQGAATAGAALQGGFMVNGMTLSRVN